MRVKYLLLIVLIGTMISCRKTNTSQPGGGTGNPPPPPPPPVSDISSVRLKDMTERNLPSPYYHFVYNDSGYITDANFASGLRIYGLEYAGKRITRVYNNTFANKDELEYVYTNGELTQIKITDQAGFLLRRCFISYTATHQLQKMEWEVKDGLGFAQERTLQLNYYPDGNLKALIHHTFSVGGQSDATTTDTFENYDTKTNVDAFSLIHTSQMHHLVLLPSFTIQRNNPQRVVRTGSGVNYRINYSYTYDAAGRPLVKTGDLVFMSGPSTGQHFETQETFSYYD